MDHLKVYARPGCHLCDDMKEVINRVAREAPLILEIVDISLHPERAQRAQIVAAPSLVRVAPLPEQRVIGDMSHTETLLQRFAFIAPDA